MSDKTPKLAAVPTTTDGEPLVLTPNPGDVARDPTSIFDDIEKLRVESKVTTKIRKVAPDCKCGRPDPNLHFRSYPDNRMWLPAYLIRHKQDRDIYYYVPPNMENHPLLIRAMRRYTLVLIQMWPGGMYRLFPVPVLDEKPFPTDKKQHEAFELSLHVWVRLEWDSAERNFAVDPAEDNPMEPTWPTEPFSVFLKRAFAGALILDSDDHEYVKQLRGIA